MNLSSDFISFISHIFPFVFISSNFFHVLSFFSFLPRGFLSIFILLVIADPAEFIMTLSESPVHIIKPTF